MTSDLGWTAPREELNLAPGLNVSDYSADLAAAVQRAVTRAS